MCCGSDAAARFVPLYALTPSRVIVVSFGAQLHNSDTLKSALGYIKNRLKTRFGISWNPATFMMDDSPVELAAVKAVWGTSVRIKDRKSVV